MSSPDYATFLFAFLILAGGVAGYLKKGKCYSKYICV